MTYCVERTKLLATAGRELAEKLLPEPFKLWFSNHDTGIQMAIVTGGQPLFVWRGSIWHSGRYEFNDRDHHPGLQPEFDFAAPVIDKYFEEVAKAVAARNDEYRKQNEQRAAQEATAKAKTIEAVRNAIAALI